MRAYNAQKNELKPHLKEQWVIPPKQNADFVAAMKDVLEVYRRPYNPLRPVVCLDEQSKQLVKSEEVFSQVTDTLLRSMEVKVNRQRLDSTHVLSDMSTMGRAQMIGVALRRFFHKLEKHDAQSAQPSLLERCSDELLRRYRKQPDSRIFADGWNLLRAVAMRTHGRGHGPIAIA